MRFKPHDYQRYAIEFIENHPIAAILLDMGMGKKAITLMAVEYTTLGQFGTDREENGNFKEM